MPDPCVGARDKFPAYLSHLTNSAAASKEHSALHYLFIRNPDGYVTEAKKKAMLELSADYESFRSFRFFELPT